MKAKLKYDNNICINWVLNYNDWNCTGEIYDDIVLPCRTESVRLNKLGEEQSVRGRTKRPAAIVL